MTNLGTTSTVSSRSDGIRLNACATAERLLRASWRGHYFLALHQSSAEVRSAPVEFAKAVGNLVDEAEPVCETNDLASRHAQVRTAYESTMNALESIDALNKEEAEFDHAPTRPDDADTEQRFRQRRERLLRRLEDRAQELALLMKKLAAELVMKATGRARGISGDLSPIHIVYAATDHLLSQTRLLSSWPELRTSNDHDLVSLAAAFFAALSEARGVVPIPGYHWTYWIESPGPRALRIFNEHADWLASRLLSEIAPEQLSRMTNARSKFKLDQTKIDPRKLDVGALTNILRCRYGLNYSQLATDLVEEEQRVLRNAPKLRAGFANPAASQRPTLEAAPPKSQPTEPKPGTLADRVLRALRNAPGEFLPDSRLPGVNSRNAIKELRKLGWTIDTPGSAAEADLDTPGDAIGYRLRV